MHANTHSVSGPRVQASKATSAFIGEQAAQALKVTQTLEGIRAVAPVGCADYISLDAALLSKPGVQQQQLLLPTPPPHHQIFLCLLSFLHPSLGK